MCLSQEIEEPPATLNACAQEQCKPKSSAVVNLLCQPADDLQNIYLLLQGNKMYLVMTEELVLLNAKLKQITLQKRQSLNNYLDLKG